MCYLSSGTMCQWLTSVKFGHTKWLCLFTNEMNKNLSSFFCVLAFLLRKLVDCKKWVCWEVRFWLNQNWFGKNDATSVFSVRVNIILFLTSVCIFRISRTTSIFSYNLLSASNPTQPNPTYLAIIVAPSAGSVRSCCTMRRVDLEILGVLRDILKWLPFM